MCKILVFIDMLKLTILLGLLVCVGDDVAAQGVSKGRDEGGQISLSVGAPAPMFALKEFGGDFVFLKQYCGKNGSSKGIKAILLDFFSVDCLACGNRLAALKRFPQEYWKKGLVVLLISIDPRPEDVLPNFLAGENVKWPVLTDMYRKVLSKYGFSTVPQTVLLDRNCRIVHITGKADNSMSVTEKFIKTAIK